MENSKLEKVLNKRKNFKLNEFACQLGAIKSGIIFLYSSWSPTIVQLNNLITSLDQFINIELFVFDIDDFRFMQFKDTNGIRSDGWGETYWVRLGEIVATLKKYDSSNMEQLIKNNKSILL